MNRRSLRRFLSYALLTSIALFLVAPFLFMALVSLHESRAPIPELDKTHVVNGLSVSQLIPQQPQWSNYPFILFMPELPVWRFFLNSVIVAVCVVLGQLLVCSLAAYGFARLKFWGREGLFSLFLLSIMFTGVVTQIPVYLMVRSFGWLDSFAALIVPGLSSSFNIFLLRQFFAQIPFELDEAARMDGATDLLIWWKVLMPLAKPALATAAAFTFIGAWNDFFWPLLATNSVEMRTLEVGLSVFKNSYGSTNWPLQMTAAVIVMIPTALVFLLAQKQFVRGITMGSLK